MMSPNLLMLYVENAEQSTAFYNHLLGKTPVQASENFSMYVLDSGFAFGLWSKKDVKPAIQTISVGTEIAFAMADNDAVNAKFEELKAQGLEVAQAVEDMDFSRTFVVLDADGHRLRIYSPMQS
ncbi:VOC family protein [Leucothrix arctica]|uniref:Drug:proton antiporter n=1 Tax=Leucothrix arctica TaxID=1481894 RepID=A0A317CHC8_9GAMM|nr:VOC family protein [Leucothrix arctica]PWQ97769.1 drug:proton antiporter [Leucothrix arctica]